MAKRIEKKTQTYIPKNFKVGDMLRVSSNEELIQRKQVDCGGYSKIRMGDLRGSLVFVKHFSPKCVKVERLCPGYEGRDYDLHPDILDYPKEDCKNGKSEASKRNSLLFEAINNNDMDRFFELIDSETLNCPSDDGKTPINFACCLGNIEIVKCLLDFGADIEIADCQGYLPIHNCAINDEVAILKLLLERSPDHYHRKSETSHTLMNIVRQKKNKELEIYLMNFNESTKERISEPRELSLPISLFNPQITLSVPNHNVSSESQVRSYPSNVSSSFLSPPQDDSVRFYQQLLQGYETIEVPNIIQSDERVSISTSPVENECTICRDGFMNIAFVRCGHLACKRCSDRIFKCHICNAEIESKITIYL